MVNDKLLIVNVPSFN